MSTLIVLAPGFWLGAWAWDQVAPALRDEGFTVSALTLPGLDAEVADHHLATLDDQAEAISAALDRPADRRILVVHSGAAISGTLVLDRQPRLVDHVVYVDTFPMVNGFALDADYADETLPLDARWDEEMAEGSMRDLTEEQLATFRARAVPQPADTVRRPLTLTNPERLDVPGTVVCTSFSAEQYQSYAAQGVPFMQGLTEYRALRLVDLPTGHWPMWSTPVELTRLIIEAA